MYCIPFLPAHKLQFSTLIKFLNCLNIFKWTNALLFHGPTSSLNWISSSTFTNIKEPTKGRFNPIAQIWRTLLSHINEMYILFAWSPLSKFMRTRCTQESFSCIIHFTAVILFPHNLRAAMKTAVSFSVESSLKCMGSVCGISYR